VNVELELTVRPPRIVKLAFPLVVHVPPELIVTPLLPRKLFVPVELLSLNVPEIDMPPEVPMERLAVESSSVALAETVNVPFTVVVPPSVAVCPALLIVRLLYVVAMTVCPADVFVY
jgi:hypothetical protein